MGTHYRKPCKGCGRTVTPWRSGYCSPCWRANFVRFASEDRHPDPRYSNCLHCQRAKLIQARGLCRRCHNDTDIRWRYPETRPGGASRGVPDRTGSRPLPAEPTAIPPGPARVDVLAARAAAGEQLFHPRDFNGDTM